MNVRKGINMMKKLIMMFAMLLAVMSLTGCGKNQATEGMVDTQDLEDAQENVISDEFVPVYVQKRMGLNYIAVYHHVPTGQMYICYVGYSMAPMGITYDEYMEAAKAYHKNDMEQVDGIREEQVCQKN